MCRLFGFRSAVPSRAHRSLVEAQNALVRQSSSHPDGWGIGWIHGEDAYVVKTANAAFDCDRFRRVTEGLRSHTFVAHVRKATVGHLDHLNAHPFRHGRWLFAHNGTLYGGSVLYDWLVERVEPARRPLIVGDTDSEALFHYLLSALEQAGQDPQGRRPSDAAVVGRTVREALHELDAEAVRLDIARPLTNVILTDGRALIAHRAGMPLLLSTQKHQCPDAGTCLAVKVCLQEQRPRGHAVNHLLIASEPIGTDENRWEEVPDGATVVLDASFALAITPPPIGWEAPVFHGPPALKVVGSV